MLLTTVISACSAHKHGDDDCHLLNTTIFVRTAQHAKIAEGLHFSSNVFFVQLLPMACRSTITLMQGGANTPAFHLPGAGKLRVKNDT